MFALLLLTLINLHADSCPRSTGDALGECAKQSCQAIAACTSAATAAESSSAQQSTDAGKALEAEPNLALGAFQLSDVAASSSERYAAAIKYCQDKPTALCSSVCADTKAKEPAKVGRFKTAREACLNQIKSTTDRLENGKRGSDQAKAGGEEAGKSSAAQPASSQPSSGDDAKKDKDGSTAAAAKGADGQSGTGGGGAPPSMPSMPSSSSQSSSKDQDPASAQPDCSSDMSSPTCAAQWQARCASASTSGSCQAFTGQFCQGANAHAAYCVSSATARVCADPTAASSCPVCLQARGLPVSPLIHTLPAICGAIPTLAVPTTTSTNGSSSPQSVGGGASSSAGGLQPSSVETTAPGAATKEGDDLYKKLDAGVNGGGGGGGAGAAAAESSLDVMSLMSAVPRAVPAAAESRRPASDVETGQARTSLFLINTNVLTNFCRGSNSPSCRGAP